MQQNETVEQFLARRHAEDARALERACTVFAMADLEKKIRAEALRNTIQNRRECHGSDDISDDILDDISDNDSYSSDAELLAQAVLECAEEDEEVREEEAAHLEEVAAAEAALAARLAALPDEQARRAHLHALPLAGNGKSLVGCPIDYYEPSDCSESSEDSVDEVAEENRALLDEERARRGLPPRERDDTESETPEESETPRYRDEEGGLAEAAAAAPEGLAEVVVSPQEGGELRRSPLLCKRARDDDGDEGPEEAASVDTEDELEGFESPPPPEEWKELRALAIEAEAICHFLEEAGKVPPPLHVSIESFAGGWPEIHAELDGGSPAALLAALREGVETLRRATHPQSEQTVGRLMELRWEYERIQAIRDEQADAGPVLPADAFELLVREVGQDIVADLAWEPEAVEALREAAEGYLARLFHGANLLAIHAGREHLRPADLQLISQLYDEYN